MQVILVVEIFQAILIAAVVQTLLGTVQSLNWISPENHVVSICYFQGLDLIKWPECNLKV